MADRKLASVGCASIDVQHKLLMNLVEKATESLRGSDPDGIFVKGVLEFRSALISHFAAEFDQLTACGFPGRDEHAKKHADVVNRLDDAIAALSHVTSATARFAIINEIEDAIYNHELLDDIEYAGHLGMESVEVDWEKSPVVGIDWIDEQHRQLFVVLKVFRRHALREDWPMCRFVLNRLIDRVRTHFESEDAYLKNLGSVAFGHRRHHLEALLSLEQLLETTERAALRTIDVFIFNLLYNHILDEDMRDFASPH